MIGTAHTRAFVWLLGLLLFHLLLLSVQVRTPEGHLLLRSIGMTVLAPFAASLQFVSSSTSDFLDRYAFLRSAEQEKLRLQEENDQLRIELHRLRDLVALLPRSAGYEALQLEREFKTVLAEVIGRSPPFARNRLLINVGTRKGVHHDSAVLTPEGIVGRVVSAGPFTAEVELVINNLAAAGARLEESRLEGVVEGRGLPWLLLEYIPNSQPVAVGEMVVTSGTDRIYPRGIPIGTVTSVSSAGPINHTIHVRPAVDFFRLEQVLAVVRPDEPADDRVADGDPSVPGPGQEARRE